MSLLEVERALDIKLDIIFCSCDMNIKIINTYQYVTNINILCLFVVFTCVDLVVILVVVPTTCVMLCSMSYTY